MPRPRSAAKKRTIATRKSRSKTTTSAAARSTFTCPECDKTFSRAASLGAHRNRAHGVSGASSGRAATHRPTSASTTRRRSTRSPGTSINRDALLQALFPNGIPAKESVIRDINTWLDHAEQLARQA